MLKIMMKMRRKRTSTVGNASCWNSSSSIQVYDKASPRYKKKNLREAAWDDIATAMESDGIFS